MRWGSMSGILKHIARVEWECLAEVPVQEI